MKTLDCQFRAVEKGRSICGVAQLRSERNVSTVDASVCQSCPVPDLIKKHPCVNLSVGTQIMMDQGRPVLISYGVECAWRPFSATTDVENCDNRCPQWTPIQIGMDLNVVHPVFNSADRNVTDSLLRQAVLVVLYRYHSDHPPRYGLFDVTPEYLMKALGVDIATIARVVLPMADSGEIKLKFEKGHVMFSGATITFEGIARIDREPVLGQLNTATARSIGHASSSVSDGPANGSAAIQPENGAPIKAASAAIGLFKNAATKDLI